MKRSNKKGFTIVELVIVIAIIAILAAVLIPTFASLIQKANESKDTQLVKNLNTALAADNKEHKTMTKALAAAAEFGYDVGKINASATGNEILWDSENDVFCYLKDGKVEYIPETTLKNSNVATYKLWKIYTEAPAAQTFSIYWNSDADFTAPLTVGFDAGECKNITKLNYVRTGDKQDVVIHTNGVTALTVNAENDTIYHYGEAGTVEIIKCASASYHVYGKVYGTISVNQGHVAVENGAVVAQPIVVKDTTGAVKVSAKETVTVIVEDGVNNAVAVESEKTIYIDDKANKVENKPSGAVTPINISSAEELKNNSVVDTDGNYALKAGMYKLTGNINVDKQVKTNENDKVVLDLNGFDFVSSYAGAGIVNYGDMIVNNTSETIGHVYTTDVSAQRRQAILNYGTIVINNGIFGTNLDVNSDEKNEINRGAAFENSGEAIINGGAFRSIDNGLGKGYAYAIINDSGNLQINNATVWGKMNGCISANGGNVTINNGTYTLSGTDSYYVLVKSNGTIVVNGGTFVRNDYNKDNFDRFIGAFKGMPSWSAIENLNAEGFTLNGGIYTYGGETYSYINGKFVKQ